MPTSNQKSNDFKLTIAIRIEGQNIQNLAMRVFAIIAAIVAATIKCVGT